MYQESAVHGHTGIIPRLSDALRLERNGLHLRVHALTDSLTQSKLTAVSLSQNQRCLSVRLRCPFICIFLQRSEQICYVSVKH